jgi:epoxyqueuosine reductase
MGACADTIWIGERARSLGFDLCGVVRAESFPELAQFEQWLGRGYTGEMKYLEDPRRRNPLLVREDLRSVIVCGLNYNTAHAYSVTAAARPQEGTHGDGFRVMHGGDYHEVMWKS